MVVLRHSTHLLFSESERKLPGNIVPQAVIGSKWNPCPRFRIEFSSDPERAGIPVAPRALDLQFANTVVTFGDRGEEQTVVIKWPGYGDKNLVFPGGRFMLFEVADMINAELVNYRAILEESRCYEKNWQLDPDDDLWLIELREELIGRWQVVLCRREHRRPRRA